MLFAEDTGAVQIGVVAIITSIVTVVAREVIVPLFKGWWEGREKGAAAQAKVVADTEQREDVRRKDTIEEFRELLQNYQTQLNGVNEREQKCQEKVDMLLGELTEEKIARERLATRVDLMEMEKERKGRGR
jgi:hypothetical protein